MDEATRRQLSLWMSALAEGDRTAFDPMFDALWPFFRALARKWIGDPQEADDAAQQALLKVFERASEFEAGCEALPWLVAVVANECRTLRQRKKRRREEALDVDTGTTPESDFEAVLEVLGHLSTQDQIALRAAWFGEAAPGAPVTLRKRLQRATSRFRALWSSHHDPS